MAIRRGFAGGTGVKQARRAVGSFFGLTLLASSALALIGPPGVASADTVYTVSAPYGSDSHSSTCSAPAGTCSDTASADNNTGNAALSLQLSPPANGVSDQNGVASAAAEQLSTFTLPRPATSVTVEMTVNVASASVGHSRAHADSAPQTSAAQLDAALTVSMGSCFNCSNSGSTPFLSASGSQSAAMSGRTVTYAVTLQGYPEGLPGAIQITGGIEGQVMRGQGDQGDESANASVSITSFAVTLGPSPQHITFTSSPPNPVFYGDTYTVSATGGGSGNPVTFSVGSSPGCTISGSTVTIVSADGYCEIEANQAGNAAYAPAPTAYQVVAAVPEPTTTTLSLTSPLVYGQEGQEVFAVHVGAAHGLPLPETATFQVATTSGVNLCSGTLDPSTGNGQCTMPPFALDAGSYSVDASTLVTSDLASSTSAPAPLVVNPAPTTLIASPVTYTQGPQGWTATFTARLVDTSSGQPIAREDVSFTVQGPLGSGTFDALTNEQGYAIITYQGSGLEPLNGGSQYQATFNGSNDYLSSNARGSISIGT